MTSRSGYMPQYRLIGVEAWTDMQTDLARTEEQARQTVATLASNVQCLKTRVVRRTVTEEVRE